MSDDIISGIDDIDCLMAMMDLLQILPDPERTFNLIKSGVVSDVESARATIYVFLSSIDYLKKYQFGNENGFIPFNNLFRYIIDNKHY